MVREQKGEHKEVFQELRRAGFLRARVNGALIEFRDIPKLNPRQSHTIELVVDRLVIRAGVEDRLMESMQTVVKHSGGAIIITDADDGEVVLLEGQQRLEVERISRRRTRSSMRCSV